MRTVVFSISDSSLFRLHLLVTDAALTTFKSFNRVLVYSSYALHPCSG